jgi:hypothetical protein
MNTKQRVLEGNSPELELLKVAAHVGHLSIGVLGGAQIMDTTWPNFLSLLLWIVEGDGAEAGVCALKFSASEFVTKNSVTPS